MAQKGEVRNPLMVLGLTIITCGLYGLYWIYLMTKELQENLEKPDLNPVLELVLCFIPFYVFYWVYKVSLLIDDARVKAGLAKDDKAIINVALMVCCLGIVSMYLMQASINEAWEKA